MEYIVQGWYENIKIYSCLKVDKYDKYDFNRFKEFKYIWSVLPEKNEFEKEITSRIQSGNKSFYSLTKFLGSL